MILKIEVTLSDDLANTILTALKSLNNILKIDVKNDDGEKGEVSNGNVFIEEKIEPPTIETVREYADEMGWTGFNAERFVEYYSEHEWTTKNGADLLEDDGWKKTMKSWTTNGLRVSSPSSRDKTLFHQNAVRSRPFEPTTDWSV